MKYCQDVPTAPELEECCRSCHEDADEGYADLILMTRDHEEWYVCCAQARNLDERLRQI